MKEYRLDKTTFKIMTFEEADMMNVYESDISYRERLREAYYLTSIAFGFDLENPPKLDRTVFSSRKQPG
jgi:hypothetical protein